MAKKTHQVTGTDKNGKPIVTETPELTRAQRKSLTEMPWTPAPKTRWQKIKRNLVG